MQKKIAKCTNNSGLYELSYDLSQEKKLFIRPSLWIFKLICLNACLPDQVHRKGGYIIMCSLQSLVAPAQQFLYNLGFQFLTSLVACTPLYSIYYFISIFHMAQPHSPGQITLRLIVFIKIIFIEENMERNLQTNRNFFLSAYAVELL